MFQPVPTLGDYLEVAEELENPDFYLDANGTPTRSSSHAKLAVRITARDKMLPDYAFYALQWLQIQGMWDGHEVTAENVKKVQVAEAG
jgi:hypothetical protein